MIRALGEYDIAGIRTNIGFFRQILEDPEFRAAHLHTAFIEEFFQRHQPAGPAPDLTAVAALVGALHTMSHPASSSAAPASPPSPGAGAGPWLLSGRDGLLR
jgi:pyruvate carboxylase